MAAAKERGCMQEQVQGRIDRLRKELELGQQRLQELAAEQGRVRDTMLRISGAIQVLEEMQKEAAPESDVGELEQNGSEPVALGSNARTKGA